MSIAFLSGCVSILPEEPAASQKIVLTPQLSKKIQGKSVSEALIVEKPLMLESLDSTRVKIIVHDNAGVALADFIAGVEWSDKLPTVLQEALITLYEKTGKFTAVGRAEEQFHAAYRLHLALTNFEVVKDADSSMNVMIGLSAKCVHSQGRHVLAQKNFLHKVEVQGQGLQGIIKAFEKAASVSFTEIIEWTVEKARFEKR
jgi:cholesterol transport system auxiliary component